MSTTRTFGALKTSFRKGRHEETGRHDAANSSRRTHRLTIRIFDVRVDPSLPERLLPARIATIIGVPIDEVQRFSVVRRGYDARRKGDVRRVYTVECSLGSPSDGGGGVRPGPRREAVRTAPRPVPDLPGASAGAPSGRRRGRPGRAVRRPHAGAVRRPPGRAGAGRPVEERAGDVARFWRDGTLDPESNAQFGRGARERSRTGS